MRGFAASRRRRGRSLFVPSTEARTREVALVLHDVAPATWRSCERLLALIEGLDARAPVTLLVVPEFHHRPGLQHDSLFRAAIDARLTRGDEIALHGFTHLDEGPAPASAAEWFARRVLTNGEGEFSTLSRAGARERIERGLALFHACGWKPAGFVPPAWQIGAEALAAVAEFSNVFEYTSTLKGIRSLALGQSFEVPCLGYSARSRARRALSLLWNRMLAAQLRERSWLRVALHPVDAEHETTLRGWTELLGTLLRERRAVRKSSLLHSLARGALQSRPTMPRREPIS